MHSWFVRFQSLGSEFGETHGIHALSRVPREVCDFKATLTTQARFFTYAINVRQVKVEARMTSRSPGTVNQCFRPGAKLLFVRADAQRFPLSFSREVVAL